MVRVYCWKFIEAQIVNSFFLIVTCTFDDQIILSGLESVYKEHLCSWQFNGYNLSISTEMTNSVAFCGKLPIRGKYSLE